MSPPLPSDLDLSGRVALVTGATRGLGAAIAARLAALGARVALTSRDGAAAERAAAAHRDGIGLACEVSDAGSVAAAVDALVARTGRIDILVNNAGVAPPPAPIEETTEADWDRVLAADLKGPFLLCRAVVPHMKRQGRGRIVNIGSTGWKTSFNPIIPYAAAKGGLVSLTRLLAMELAPSGITVNAVLPGPIETEMLRELMPAERRARVAAAVPLGRLGTPEELAAAVAHLCSDAAAWITGEALTVGGGLPGRRIGV
jgi:NAD(P)-dependent dehydrogenase (short-subunit alcohol dehydrogenase family)